MDAISGVRFDDATGLRVAVFVVDVFRRKVVLDHFVFYNTHTRLGNGFFGQLNTFCIGSNRSSFEDLVHLFLGVGAELGLCRFDAGDHGVQFFYGRCALDDGIDLFGSALDFFDHSFSFFNKPQIS
ncbi:hypothetical protein SDC9_190876 [bioreactor metagenome]|uniref:Uncharacterized protein n=1 Tax=bioreactor metagenome TaxID=1076179 RepID=A0A645HWE3_9ZZZZ